MSPVGTASGTVICTPRNPLAPANSKVSGELTSEQKQLRCFMIVNMVATLFRNMKFYSLIENYQRFEVNYRAENMGKSELHQYPQSI